MKFVVDIEIEIQSECIKDFAGIFFDEGYSVNRIQLSKKEDFNETYLINLIHSSQKQFEETVNKVSNDPRCITITVTNRLEQKITEGLISVDSRLQYENEEEFETNHRGAYELLEEKIKTTDKANSPFYHQAVCSVSGYMLVNNRFDKREAELRYLRNEQVASVISRFSGVNCFPQVITYSLLEDFIKTLISLQANYNVYRIEDLDDDDDPEVYQNVIDQMRIPSFSSSMTEKPILILSALFHCIKKYKLKIENTTIGLIGLDSSAISLTQLMKSMNCMRILGFDHNEKSMMLFESKNGLATTRENIFDNCDIVIINRDQVEKENLKKVRPGIIAISTTVGESKNLVKDHRSCKYFVDKSNFDYSLITPGIVRGLMKSRVSTISDDLVVKIAKLLTAEGNKLHLFPGIFSDIHEKIESLFDKELAPQASEDEEELA